MRVLLKWIDDQTDLVSGIRQFMEEPLHSKVGWPHVFGSLVLFFFIVQIATGIMLMAYYSPSPDHAYSTVQYITYKLPFGSFVRGLHHWAASGMIIALGLHLLQTFIWGAYKKPRQIIWLIGVCLLLVALTVSFTGYLLPWDQKAYWATVVGTNIAGSVPVVGDLMRSVMRGGETVGAVTLTRFFALHVGILPPIIVALLIFHVLQVRKKGITPPGAPVGEEVEEETPRQFFWPHQVLKDAVAAFFALGVVSFLALHHGAPIEPLANPADTAYIPRPEWYFLWLFEMLKYFPGKLEFVGAVLLPGLAIGFLAAYPYLDRNPSRVLRERKGSAYLCLGTFIVVSILGISAVVSKPKPQVLTAIQQEGQKVFLDLRCQSCHGVNGGGGTAGIDLAQGFDKDRARLVALLQDPTQFNERSIMPPAHTSPARIEALVEYLLVIGSNSRLETEPSTGPRKPPSHFDEQWYIDHKYEVRKDPSQCSKCHEPEFCQSCHRNRKPDSHLVDWLRAHHGTAREKPEYCAVCHEQQFCNSCHDKATHTDDWLSERHGTVALQQPELCGACHKGKLCTACHQRSKPASHGSSWMREHGRATLYSTAACMSCHQESACDTCHGVKVPHGRDWFETHGKQASDRPQVCVKCHMSSERSCLYCHKMMPPASKDGPPGKAGHLQWTSRADKGVCKLCHSG